MKNQTFAQQQLIHESHEKVFAFFANPVNLDSITPPWLQFRTVSELPMKMEEGTTMEHTLRLHGLPIRWVTQIIKWSPPYSFTDFQEKGPFATWTHSHEFTSTEKGIMMTDNVIYRVPGGRLGRVIDKLYVRGDINRIFAYRKQSISRLLAAQNLNNPAGPAAGPGS
jgi:ligand-binding SRPBCC domain-containing protein